jgi:hypothetical protein
MIKLFDEDLPPGIRLEYDLLGWVVSPEYRLENDDVPFVIDPAPSESFGDLSIHFPEGLSAGHYVAFDLPCRHTTRGRRRSVKRRRRRRCIRPSRRFGLRCTKHVFLRGKIQC